ncbi:oligosaccharide flippase family protein [Gemmatimonadota bacterium]
MANTVGQMAAIFFGLLTVPFYINLLGDDAFGLVSFFLSLQAVLVIVDFGLSTAVMRDISLLVAQRTERSRGRDLLRTAEVLYFGLATLVFLAFVLLSDWISTSWLQASTVDPRIIRSALLLAGGIISLRLPTILYQGFLRGLERQVVLNVTVVSITSVKALGSIALLLWISRSLIVFYWWLLAFSVLEILLLIVVTWKSVGGLRGRATFRIDILKATWSFGARIGGLSIFAMIMKQMDKMLISRLLPIAQLGYFNAASLASHALTNITSPIQNAVFPKLSQLSSASDESALAELFHKSCKIIAFVVSPAASILAFYSHDILLIWTQSSTLSGQASTPLTILALAMMLNTSMTMPFTLQLAAGMTWLPFRNNAVWAIVFPFFVYVLVSRYGITGGALAWLIYNVIYFITIPAIMFRTLLIGHHWKWLSRDTLPFMVCAIALFWSGSMLSRDAGIVWRGVAVLISGSLYLFATLSVSRTIRGMVKTLLARKFNKVFDEKENDSNTHLNRR